MKHTSVIRNCVSCRKTFNANIKKQKYCSKNCAAKNSQFGYIHYGNHNKEGKLIEKEMFIQQTQMDVDDLIAHVKRRYGIE